VISDAKKVVFFRVITPREAFYLRCQGEGVFRRAVSVLKAFEGVKVEIFFRRLQRE